MGNIHFYFNVAIVRILPHGPRSHDEINQSIDREKMATMSAPSKHQSSSLSFIQLKEAYFLDERPQIIIGFETEIAQVHFIMPGKPFKAKEETCMNWLHADHVESSHSYIKIMAGCRP